MHTVIHATVPEPLWDQVAGVFILPEHLSEEESGRAVTELVRARCWTEEPAAESTDVPARRAT